MRAAPLLAKQCSQTILFGHFLPHHWNVSPVIKCWGGGGANPHGGVISVSPTGIQGICNTHKAVPPVSPSHGGIWSNRTYVALALFSLLSTCVVFWSHRRRDIVYTAVMFSPESMYITLDSSACTSHPNLKRYKCIWRFGKVTVLHQLS
jgi:hypothetical protein